MKAKLALPLFLGLIFMLANSFVKIEWGFYGHRKINRMAVFTLPQKLLPLYKSNIEYITQHAVDPDKRRYATKHEAVRHYIDIDHWGTFPFDNLPRQFSHAYLKHAEALAISGTDTTSLRFEQYDDLLFQTTALGKELNDVFHEHIYLKRYDDVVEVDATHFRKYLDIPKRVETLIFIDHLSPYGVLPYFFPDYYAKLVKAFEQKNVKRILQLSADIGHYVGDAHVPLHTTENYNGQLTDQLGIHAFWESRLPELFADENYDFFVGKAGYIPSIHDFIWEVVLESHAELPKVLEFELELKNSFPSDQQFCFEERLEYTIRTQCEKYSEAYHTKLDGMVEERMQDAIHAIGSVWYSAWIDAGQPDVKNMIDIEWSKEEEKANELLESQFRNNDIKGRVHDN